MVPTGTYKDLKGPKKPLGPTGLELGPYYDPGSELRGWPDPGPGPGPDPGPLVDKTKAWVCIGASGHDLTIV